MRRGAGAASIAVILIASTGCVRSVQTTRHAPAGAPPSAVAATMRRQVINAAEAGDGDAIANQLRRQIAADPGRLESRLALAAHYGRTGLPDLELEHLRLAIERFPQSPMPRLALARALRRAGVPGQAAQLLESSPQAAPTPELLNELGICYDEAGDWKSGEQAFRRALAIAPNLDYLHNNLGYNLLVQQRVSEAVAALEEALKRNPRSATAQNNLGVALARSPGISMGEALKHFENVTDAATAHSNLAAALIEQQRYEEGRRLLQASLEYSRSNVAALANLRLVSELDGKPAALPPGRRNWWLWPLTAARWVFLPEHTKPAAFPAEPKQIATQPAAASIAGNGEKETNR